MIVNNLFRFYSFWKVHEMILQGLSVFLLNIDGVLWFFLEATSVFK